MNFVRCPRQGGCLALFVLCLGLCSPAAAQTPASGWTSLDIGADLPGGTSVASDGFFVYGAGTDIWNQSDEFRFVYRPLTGRPRTESSDWQSTDMTPAFVHASVAPRSLTRAMIAPSPGSGRYMRSCFSQERRVRRSSAEDPSAVRR